MGAEGPTDDEGINEIARERQTRNFLATLMLSQGVFPCSAGGDEVGRSQMREQ